MAQLYTTPEEKSRLPALYATIPSQVLFDDQLRAGAKLLYGVISAISAYGEDCWATDAYFADVFKTNVKTIQAYIRNLTKAKYISVIVEQHTAPGQQTRRRIKLNVSLTGEHGNKNSEHGNKNSIQEEILLPCSTSNKINNNISIGEDEKVTTLERQLTDWVGEYCSDWDEASRLDVTRAIRDFVQYRKESKHAMTKTGMTTLLNKLNRLAHDRPLAMCDMLYTAIDNGWRTIYPPKPHQTQTRRPEPMPSDGMEAF